jgi:hypothetical protein
MHCFVGVHVWIDCDSVCAFPDQGKVKAATLTCFVETTPSIEHFLVLRKSGVLQISYFQPWTNLPFRCIHAVQRVQQ